LIGIIEVVSVCCFGGLDFGFAFWDFEFLTNTQLARISDAIGFHEVAIGHLKASRDGVEVVAAVEDERELLEFR